MKIILVLKGHHFCYSNSRSFSFEHTRIPIERKLIKPLVDRFNDFDLVLNTYSSPVVDDLVRLYNPSFFFVDSESSSSILKSFQSLLNRLNAFGLSNAFIVVSRFDIVFKSRLNFDMFKFDRFNTLFLCKGMANNLWFDDNLFAFPSDYISYLLHTVNNFANSTPLSDYHHRNLHWLFAETDWNLPSSLIFNCVDPIPFRSDYNPYFYLFRGTTISHRFKPVVTRFLRSFR